MHVHVNISVYISEIDVNFFEEKIHRKETSSKYEI